jgi:SAM-dependent methyltransferase
MPLILFVLSSLVLSLEVLETKIFAYSLENSLIFLVVGVVLLGFGAGGTALSLRRELGDVRTLVRGNLLAMAVLLVAAHVWFAHFSDRLEFELDAMTVATLAILAAPYFSAGMAISAILAEPGADVHRRYGLNLLGSAVGCLSVFGMLGPLTAPRCLVVCAVVAALCAVPLARRRAALLAVVVVAGAPLWWFADAVFPYRMQKAPGGQLALIIENARKTVATADSVQRIDVVPDFDRWDPTARVQVHSLRVETTDPNVVESLERLPSMWFTQDSSYGSPLIGRGLNPDGVRGVYERTSYGVGYFRRLPSPDVLVIGLGGAPDIQCALHNGAGSVTGVDINASALAMARGPLRDFLGDPYADPRVQVFLRDGRSFVRSSARRYDLIQLSGVDTKSVLAAGTLALNESYLYTREAMDEYLAHLEPDGILCIGYAGDHFRQRLAITAMASLRAAGADRPERHLMITEQNAIFCLLVKPTEFSADECARMDEWLRGTDLRQPGAAGAEVGIGTDVTVWVYELLTPGLSLRAPVRALWIPDGRPTTEPAMQAAVEGRLDRFIADSRFDLSPAPDERPFFFNLHRTDQVLADPPRHFRRMFNMLVVMSGLALLLILGPLVVLGLRGVQAWSSLPFALYFAALGAGYIMAMSGLIQRYVLFLGHQAYAFGVVIGGLLVAAGLGSLLAGRFSARPGRVMVGAVTAICASLLFVQLGLDRVFGMSAGLDLTARIGVALAVLLPLGVPLGMMFPTGLALVKRRSPLFVPWAFGINGVFSVVGTTIVLPGSILFGFPTMAAAAGATYLLALLVGLPLARRG